MELRFIVKLGGAAITNKNSFETLDDVTLQQCVEHLKEVYSRNHKADFLVVHGAGSFGHFQASQANVAKGGLNQPNVRMGFVKARCASFLNIGVLHRAL